MIILVIIHKTIQVRVINERLRVLIVSFTVTDLS